jgi:hypothetical protein
MPDPFAQYGKMQQLESGRQEMQIRQQEMQDRAAERQRLVSEREKRTTFLSGLGAELQKGGQVLDRKTLGQMIQSGIPEIEQLGFKGIQALDDDEKFQSEMGKFKPAQAPVTPAVSGALGSGTFGMAPAPANALATPAPTAAPANAMVGGYDRRQMEAMLTSPNARVREMGSKLLGAIPKEDYQTAAPGSTVLRNGQVIYTAPEKAAAPPSMVAEYTFAKTPDGGNFKGSYQDFVTARAAAGRAPAQPVAPTITQIVDPTNPNQMISIDAKRYQGGGAGSPGVIGVSGKEPGAALRQNKVEAGKTQLADDLDNLRASFQTLDAMRSIPSTERNPISNVLSGISATGIGQKTGQLFGTEAQVERDVINSARSRLVNSIKNATGMSAQQLNSNVELQTMLRSISDPGHSIQAAMRIIDDIENAYVKGNGELPKRNPAPGKPAAAAPNIDALLNKYK